MMCDLTGAQSRFHEIQPRGDDEAKGEHHFAHPASTRAISACPVTNDRGPPSRTSAAA